MALVKNKTKEETPIYEFLDVAVSCTMEFNHGSILCKWTSNGNDFYDNEFIARDDCLKMNLNYLEFTELSHEFSNFSCPR